ncbi:dephospho-CoA kinase [Acidovorax sp. NCPPB 4044]|uniref:dephospho-CoA kinase n=1 Tax=Acidovorax sp. NCPPB 4044 TaxID=2940490 RepID=UPI002304BD48|nr:dephospho-CoA kinase [Acidovorax sp. NCPPB 4044]MDA8522106.1 dephospho-CoA kinase [Acidovorax sp. NCPPB 4044]
MNAPSSRRPALRLGLTGGIGSGKTTVGQWLEGFGAALIDADQMARAATAAGGIAIPAIRAAFGDGLIGADGAMDRARMRELAFRDAGARQRLEAIVHPVVGQAIHAAAEQAVAAGARVVVFDIPLLAESPRWPPVLDRILVVDCSEATQVARVQARNGLAREVVESIIASQAPRAMRRSIADLVLHNDGIPLETLRTEVRRIADGFGL